MAIRMTVNGRPVENNDDPRTPLLWVLRDTLGLSGTKFGCSIALCGACTVMVEGNRTFNASPPGLPIASNL
jgi:isoquinoline 1-oxidoreductase alpha subunit